MRLKVQIRTKTRPDPSFRKLPVFGVGIETIIDVYLGT